MCIYCHTCFVLLYMQHTLRVLIIQVQAQLSHAISLPYSQLINDLGYSCAVDSIVLVFLKFLKHLRVPP